MNMLFINDCMLKYKVYTDGGSRGNPGPAACGVIIFDSTGKIVDFTSEYIGDTTNNVAEYKALLLAFNLLSVNKISGEVTFYLDSELIVKQLNGEYKVRDTRLKEYNNKVKVEITKINSFAIVHVPRKQNKYADKLVNIALDINDRS